MPDLLLEVLSEEIPARMQAGGARELERQVLSRLDEARLAYENPRTFATPRRLALIVQGLPAEQPDISVERKGPRVDAPAKAIEGFLKSTGLTLADCEQRETPKGPVWFAVTRQEGRPTGALLAELLPQALAAVSWPKSMRWEESGTRWVRPIRSILCLLDDEVVPFRFGAVDSGRTTLGHRFLSSGPLIVADADNYVEVLEGAHVVVLPEQRAEKIAEAAQELADDEGLIFVRDDRLLTENAGLVEWPVVRMGTIDERFMDLPVEVLHSAMGTHQRYFGLMEGIEQPAPRFVMVANTEVTAVSTEITGGNERVLRARLADARFFWDQDRRQPLEEYLPALKGVVFHARLGTMYEKAQRIAVLARALCPAIPGADPSQATRAGILCKADLVTEMVGEFPDLQGTMGSYYAKADGEEEAVYEAIASHYAPRGPNDLIPTKPVSVAVTLADKLDTLAGFFAIDERPTGSKDPFALRRAALGVIRLITENTLRLSLRRAFDDALAGYGVLLPEAPGAATTSYDLLVFFADRVKVHLREQGVRHDLINAVFREGDEDDLVRLLDRVDVLARFLKGDDGANLLTAYRRAANILRIEEKKDGERYDGAENRSLFVEAEEHALYKRINKTITPAHDALVQEKFEEAMAHMATLRAPVDAFFDRVTVNCDEPDRRRNPAADALSDSCHARSGGRLLGNRGLSRGRVGLSLRRG